MKINDYENDPTLFKDLLEFLVIDGNETAIRLKAEGLDECMYGYEGTPEERGLAARTLIEEFLTKGSETALILKAEGLKNQFYGYKSTPETRTLARDIIDSLVEKGNEKAVKLKLDALESSRYLSKKIKHAKKILEQMVMDRYPYAIELKALNLVEGGNFYNQDLIAATEMLLNEEQIMQMIITK